MSVKNTQLDIMQRKLEQHRSHEQRGLLLLKLGFLLTFLLYLLFNQHLYLGDALSWSAYFKDAASIFGFTFTVLIVVLMALFLSWVKHHAYLHFGFFGSVALVVSTVIGFALFAEFFSSSANQDVKASVLLERNSAYQATLTQDPSPSSAVNTGLITSIANAEQKLARCEENLKLGKEKHCNGDRAKVAALRSSEQSANQAQANASIERDKLKYERQDELKAQAYNPVILTLARVLAGESGDYKDYLKTAVVIITLFVAVCFEILHHFLSKSHGASMAAIEDLELALAKYSAQPEPVLPSAPPHVQPITEPNKQPIGFGFPQAAPSVAHGESKPMLFKYQAQAEPKSALTKQGFMGFLNPHQTTRKQLSPVASQLLSQTSPIIKQPANKHGTQEEQLPLPDFGGFKSRRDTFASPALSDSETPSEPQAGGLNQVYEMTPRKPLAGGSDGLFNEWVKAVKAKECKPSVDPTWTWIQKRISNKETGSRTHDRTRISHMQKAFFSRAMKEGLMIENPNYTNGGKKYLWIA
ncbi:hypothetical protein [Thiothrix eikelboomii]|uniref:hypothetical protein n=1 Tax=Thiothrix eikelboomii TaxID=92487 RepID=UPI003BAE2B87